MRGERRHGVSPHRTLSGRAVHGCVFVCVLSSRCLVCRPSQLCVCRVGTLRRVNTESLYVPCLPPQTRRSTEHPRGARMGNAQEYFVAGGIAGVVSRTAIAPIERVKILYQVSRASVSTSWLQLAPQIWREEGFLAFWKGNTAAVTRVLPYMSLTFLSYEEYRAALQRSGLSKTSSTIAAGSAAGVTAVALTYPLDLVRATMVRVRASQP